MAVIKPTIQASIDLSNPVDELAQVIAYVISSSVPELRKSILEGLDLEIGNALASLEQAEEGLRKVIEGGR
ncbi:hypothetical protein J2Z32_002511 [Paenibacillus turicensis]|uniref:Uncharacterized protein n=1 Tax=Paenibacillus turicensis TaxID=160487 RepID=A0ABS4FU41_9BACL|nr:hypothetical protein [Paenibacillus turicensis]MBP1905863.1 hypothetical protein [Paenibacillus turicensis]